MTKGRDSGMPAVEQWESYFDAAGISSRWVVAA